MCLIYVCVLCVYESPFHSRGLVSGATMMIPCSEAARWLPDLVMKFCSVHVSPVTQKHIHVCFTILPFA